MEKLSLYLNLQADFIKEDMINVLVNECGLKKKESFAMLFAEACGFDMEDNPQHRELFERYFPEMISELNEEDYKNNLYYKNIKIPEIENRRWQFKMEKYKPYEAFVFDDLKKADDGRIIPQIGFFDKEFNYPAVLEDNREWMLITPNEIETMKEAVDEAEGRVLTYGLGLGYYAYMVSEKEDVSVVTIVEKDEDIIDLFERYILPQFQHKDKIKVIHDDAFSYAENYMSKSKYDFVFTDIWHDPADGIDMYLKMKEYEKKNPQIKFMYWIEKTMKCYMTDES